MNDSHNQTEFETVDEAYNELIRCRIKLAKLREAGKLLLSNWPEGQDGMDYSEPLPIGVKSLREELKHIIFE